MDISDMKVGQIIRHDNGFFAEVKAIKGDDIHLEITSVGSSICHKVGDKYVGLAKCCRLAKNVDHKVSTNNKLVIDVEVNGLEKFREELVDVEDALMGVRAEAEALSESVKADTVFTAKLGEGISFKGTKSDFEAFIKGMTQMMKTGMGSSL